MSVNNSPYSHSHFFGGFAPNHDLSDNNNDIDQKSTNSDNFSKESTG